MQLIDPFLFLIIAILLGVIVWLLHQAREERTALLATHTQDRNKLINALIARKPEELRDLTLADKVGPIAPAPDPTPPDIIPFDQLTDDQFEAHIKAELENE